ncbi:MAG: hypothetical protein SPL89_04360 [Clostridia bacterium]|nr:hypothetical protein [Clostridia bacterium]
MKKSTILTTDDSKLNRGILTDILGSCTFNLPWHHERWDGNGYPDGLEENLNSSPSVFEYESEAHQLAGEMLSKKALPLDDRSIRLGRT